MILADSMIERRNPAVTVGFVDEYCQRCTTVVDDFKEIGCACDSDGSELKLDESYARKTNGE